MTPTPVPWHTPTPMPTSDATPVIDFTQTTGVDLAESVVGGYQWANGTGMLDMLWLAFALFVGVGGVWSIIKRLQSMRDS